MNIPKICSQGDTIECYTYHHCFAEYHNIFIDHCIAYRTFIYFFYQTNSLYKTSSMLECLWAYFSMQYQWNWLQGISWLRYSLKHTQHLHRGHRLIEHLNFKNIIYLHPRHSWGKLAQGFSGGGSLENPEIINSIPDIPYIVFKLCDHATSFL